MNPTGILRKCNSWQDFKASLRDFSEKDKGNCYESLTEYFLRLDPKYVTLLKNVWPLRKAPANIRKYLNLPDPDEGIDLLAETTDGQYWAIQCKYLEDERGSLGRHSLSTFFDLSFNLCKHINFCLVCTTADRFSYKLARYGERLGLCSGETWRSLDDGFFSRLHRLVDGASVALAPFKPRPHQRVAISHAYRHFIKDRHSRGKLIMPCGTGKTLAAYWIAEKLKAQTILLAAPSLALIGQTLEVWSREFVADEKNVRWIAVCSDESVGEFERDDISILTQDLGIHVHTDPDEIAEWLKQRNDEKTVVFTTYQSGRAVAEAARNAGTSFDLGIMDEAHKTVGRKHNLFGHLLFDENIDIKKRIFMTATERRYLGQSGQIASMDDPKLYGETFELLTFKKALESRPSILSDYEIVTIGVTRREVAALIKGNLFVRPDTGTWDNDVEAETLAALIALRKAMLKYPIRHAVSFHSRIARAKIFAENVSAFTMAFPAYGNLETFHVYGGMPTAIRKREMASFAAANRALITNARCLTEGVDVPNIDAVLFADPKRSTVDIVQAVGRALRPSPGKSIGYIIVPELLNGELTDSQPADHNRFKNVLTVLRALAAHDERIIEYFRGISQGRRPTRGKQIFSLDIPEGVEIDTDNFIHSIELQFWSRLAKLSWRPFNEARAFVHQLNLKSETEWRSYYRSELREKGSLPNDIPTNPHRTYKDQGWQGIGDWLGTFTVAPRYYEPRPFAQAREFVHRLELKSFREWQRYCGGELPGKGIRPKDIPTNPGATYEIEWKNWGDWLGTGNISSRKYHYRPFSEALTFVHGLKLGGKDDWVKYCKGELDIGKRPNDIPATPDRTYNEEWKGWGDWLGTFTHAPRYYKPRPFEQAREFVHILGLKSVADWKKYCQGKLSDKESRPTDIPVNAYQTYKDKWKGWGDWLGTFNRISSHYKPRPFEQAREFVRGLGLKSASEWRKFTKDKLPEKGMRPKDIPTAPYTTYRKEWKSWKDWLGTKNLGPKDYKFKAFGEARAFVRSLRLEKKDEWEKYCKDELPEKGIRPEDIPVHPERTYKGEWKDWGDWLGTWTTGTRHHKYRQFTVARDLVHGLELKSWREWQAYCKGELPKKGIRLEDIPIAPNIIYKREWKDWGDWLGVNAGLDIDCKYRPFAQAREFVHRLELKSWREWQGYCKGEFPNKGMRPRDIPWAPDVVFKAEWKDWGDWLDTQNTSTKNYKSRPFSEARAFVHHLRIQSVSEWRKYCKGDLQRKMPRPADIPTNPHRSYKYKGWKNWKDWLGV